MTKDPKPTSENASSEKHACGIFRNFFVRLSQAFRRHRRIPKNTQNRSSTQSLDLIGASSHDRPTLRRSQAYSASTGQLQSEDLTPVNVHVDGNGGETRQNFKEQLNARLRVNPPGPLSTRKPPGAQTPNLAVDTSQPTDDESLGRSPHSSGDTTGASPSLGQAGSPTVHAAPAGDSLSIVDALVSNRVGANKRNRRPPTQFHVVDEEREAKVDDLFFSRSPATPSLWLNRIAEEKDRESSPTPPTAVSATPAEASTDRSSLQRSTGKCADSSGGDDHHGHTLSPVPPEKPEIPATEPTVEAPRVADDPATSAPSSSGHSSSENQNPKVTVSRLSAKPRLRRVAKEQSPATASPAQGTPNDGQGEAEEEEDIGMSSVAKRASVFGVIINPVNKTAKENRPSRTHSLGDQNGLDSVHPDSSECASKESSADQHNNKRNPKVFNLIQTFQPM